MYSFLSNRRQRVKIGDVISEWFQMLSGALIGRVVTFKLLGVNVASDMKWNTHIEAISRKVAFPLYFLKQLKRAGAGLAHGTVPAYPTELCSRCVDSRLRSSTRGDFVSRRTRTRFADSSFACSLELTSSLHPNQLTRTLRFVAT